ncbi:hypothetical protein LTS18_014920, partial [Coniosporium uncinatum]
MDDKSAYSDAKKSAYDYASSEETLLSVSGPEFKSGSASKSTEVQQVAANVNTTDAKDKDQKPRFWRKLFHCSEQQEQPEEKANEKEWNLEEWRKQRDQEWKQREWE